MPPTEIYDPVGALIAYLNDNAGDFWPANLKPFVTYYTQDAAAAPYDWKSPRLVGIKPAGMGDGQGQRAMARYESMRIDAIAAAESDIEAWDVGLFMHQAILSARGKFIPLPEERGVDYAAKFVNLIQSGGPSPFQDAPDGRGSYRSVLYVYSVNYTTF